ncbi:vWA domain-containing protein [Zestomonas thermotolerans]|uniref:vWA domain-containing protein n=1 Tax=Zestomonas thermotolerans TaxID=157784 RepID=UPI0003735CC3|nr:VWA domain-containing protein [Pseudomonas thermotolerans]
MLPTPLRPPLLCVLSLALIACSQPPAEPPREEAAVQQKAQSRALAAGKARLAARVPLAAMPTVMPAPRAERLPSHYRDEGRERYQRFADNPVQAVAEAPVSTFSTDVDTGAYANVRRFLDSGRLPPAEAVRLEEMVNYFPYAYPLPKGDAPFGVSTELAVTPWNPETRLLRIAIKASDRRVEELPPANLVFLVDVSGSMERPEGLPLVKATLGLLVEQLREEDRVSLVTYAGDSRLVLAPTSGRDKARIRAAIEELSAGGATVGEAGIQLAYQQARQGFIAGGINRILLATDGDFNVGTSDFESLKQLVTSQRRSGVSLTTLGFGTGNYNEQLMEQLADAGDGNYAYIDNLREARKVLVEQLSSTLATVARDVKLQIEFNPAWVSEYRLLGYENRQLRREDFANDKVDAGEVGAGHTVTALYEIVPAGARGWLEPLRYQPARMTENDSQELAWLRIRYKAPEAERSRLLEVPVLAEAPRAIAQASEDLRFAAAVAAFAQQLKGGQYTGDFSMADSAELARGARGEDPFGLRGEFVQLVELASVLQASQNGRSATARVE